jgi:hypothetical protein
MKNYKQILSMLLTIMVTGAVCPSLIQPVKADTIQNIVFNLNPSGMLKKAQDLLSGEVTQEQFVLVKNEFELLKSSGLLINVGINSGSNNMKNPHSGDNGVSIPALITTLFGAVIVFLGKRKIKRSY